jgi:hypothetical protein
VERFLGGTQPGPRRGLLCVLCVVRALVLCVVCGACVVLCVVHGACVVAVCGVTLFVLSNVLPLLNFGLFLLALLVDDELRFLVALG